MRDIFEMQYKLNEFTLKKLDVDYNMVVSGEDTMLSGKWLNNYMTAFQVEMFELVDDVTATYFKITQNSKVEVVDMLHFIVSMSHIARIRPEDIKIINTSLGDFKANTQEFFYTVSRLGQYMNIVQNNTIKWKWWAKGKEDRYDPEKCQCAVAKMWSGFFTFKNLLGMTFQDMKEIYMQKNRINYERQINGYNEDTKTEADNQSIRV